MRAHVFFVLISLYNHLGLFRKSLWNIKTWKKMVREYQYHSSLHMYIREKESTGWFFLKNFISPKNYSSWSCFCNLSSCFLCKHTWIQSKQIMKEILRSTSCKWPIQKIHTMKSMGFVSNSIISFLEKLKIPFIWSDLFSIVHLWRENLLQRKLGATVQFTGWTLTLSQ